MAGPTRFRTKLLRSAVLIVLLLAAGALLGGLLVAAREEPPRRAAAALPPYVDSVVLSATDATERYIGYGTAEATQAAKLAAEVPANVLERVGGIRAGSVVAASQALIRMDDREYRLAAERAEARAAAEDASIAELDVEAANLKQLINTAEQELRVTSSEKARVTDLFERGLAAKKEFRAVLDLVDQKSDEGRLARGYLDLIE